MFKTRTNHSRSRKQTARRSQPRLEALEERTLLATRYWIGGGLTDVCAGQPPEAQRQPSEWNNPVNWRDALVLGQPGVPQNGDIVEFRTGVLVTYCGDPPQPQYGPFTPYPVLGAGPALTFAAFRISNDWNDYRSPGGAVGRPITLNRNVTITGVSQWGSGHIGGSSTLTNTGTFTFTNRDEGFYNDKSLGLHLSNAGTIIHSGTANPQNLVMVGGGGLTNQAGALYHFQRNASISGGGRSIDNFGTFRKSNSEGTSSVWPNNFNNRGGTILVETGAFHVGDGTHTGGRFDVRPNTTLYLANDTNAHGEPTTRAIMTGSYTAIGGGRIQTRQITVGTVATDTATFNFARDMFQWNPGGSRGPGTLINDGEINFRGGSFTGRLENRGTSLNPATFNWFGGSLDTVTNASTGSMNLSENNPKTITNRLTNAGTTRHTATMDSGNLNINGTNSELINQGLYELQGNGFSVHGNGTVRNTSTGRFVKTGAGWASWEGGFGLRCRNEGGRIEVVAGTFGISCTGTHTGGHFQVADGAVAAFSGGYRHDMTGTYTGTGTGTAAVRFVDGNILTGGTGATLNFADNLLQWVSGRLAGTWTNHRDGTLNLSGNVFHKVVTGTLTNNGAIRHASLPNVHLVLEGDTAQLINNGVYEFLGDGAISGGGTVRNTSTGTFRKIGAGGSGWAGLRCRNEGGRIEVVTGTFGISCAGTHTGGHFQVADGAALVFSGGYVHNMTGTYTGTGTGTAAVRFVDGNILTGGTGATLNFADNLLQWVSGRLAGTWTNHRDGTLNLSGNVFHKVVTGTLTNNGAIRHASLPNVHLVLEGGMLINNGIYEFLGDGNISQGTIDNTGTFRKVGPAGTGAGIGSPFNNTGLVEVASGSLGIGPTVAQVSGSTLTGGSWYVYADASLTLVSAATNLTTSNADVTLSGPGSNFVNLNRLAVNGGRLTLRNGRVLENLASFTNAGTVVFDQAGMRLSGAYTQTAGRTTFREGGVETSLFDLQGGVLDGTGVVLGNLRNAARIDVGGENTVGFLFIVGNYTQTATGVLNIDLAGRDLLATYDFLYATGSAVLDGTLNINLQNGFLPEPDDLFVPLVADSLSGQFATINGLEYGSDGAFLPFYTDAVFALVAYRR